MINVSNMKLFKTIQTETKIFQVTGKNDPPSPGLNKVKNKLFRRFSQGFGLPLANTP